MSFTRSRSLTREALNRLKQQNEWLWLAVMGLMIGILCFCAVILILFTLSTEFIAASPANVTFNLSELSSGDANVTRGVLMELNPLYLEAQKEITFVYDLDPYSAGLSDEERHNLGGLNQRRKIYVLYFNDTALMKAILCHELLHSHMKQDEITHAMIYHLSAQNVCYKTRSFSAGTKHQAQGGSA